MTKKILTNEDIINAFPELNLLEDKSLLEKTCKVWIDAFSVSKWENLEDARFNIFCPGISLVEHTRATAQTTIDIIKSVRELYNTEVNLDLAIVMAIVHDVCKLLETELVDGKYVSSRWATGNQHAFLSGYFCHKYDMPFEVTALSVCHTVQSKINPDSIEGIIVNHADHVSADVPKFMYNQPLLLGK